MEGAEGQGSRLLLLRCSKRISRLEETDTMPPPPKTQFSLRRPVNARVKAGLGGKEGAPLPLLLWKWQGGTWRLSLGWLTLQTPGAWAPSLQEEESLRLGYRKGAGRGWAGFQMVGQGCAIAFLSDGERSANPRLSFISSCHRLLLLSISSHT